MVWTSADKEIFIFLQALSRSRRSICLEVFILLIKLGHVHSLWIKEHDIGLNLGYIITRVYICMFKDGTGVFDSIF